MLFRLSRFEELETARNALPIERFLKYIEL